MGLVAIEMDIMPESPETDLMAVKDEISKLVKVQDYKLEPMAFGLEKLKIVITTEDKGGGTDALEEQIKKIKGVSDVRVGTVTLV